MRADQNTFPLLDKLIGINSQLLPVFTYLLFARGCVSISSIILMKHYNTLPVEYD